MKANKTITATAAVAAVAVAFWNRRTRVCRARDAAFEEKCLHDAVETLEGEGGIVLS